MVASKYFLKYVILDADPYCVLLRDITINSALT